ncbi:hypothetical protein V1505DRAFT_189822 [Lipomyces doorenjongii]
MALGVLFAFLTWLLGLSCVALILRLTQLLCCISIGSGSFLYVHKVGTMMIPSPKFYSI